MPWRQMAWSWNTDDLRLGRPMLFVRWYIQFRCLFLECSWTHTFDDKTFEVKVAV
jgi:hypothetical protein